MGKVSRFLKGRFAAVMVGFSLAVSAPAAFADAAATAPDYTAITTAIDWTTTITAILAIMATMAGVYIAFKGGKLVLRALKGS